MHSLIQSWIVLGCPGTWNSRSLVSLLSRKHPTCIPIRSPKSWPRTNKGVVRKTKSIFLPIIFEKSITIWFAITRMVLSYSSFIYRLWFNFLMALCSTVKGWDESFKFLVSLLRVHCIVTSIPGLPGFTGLQCTLSNTYIVSTLLYIL